MLLLPVLIQRIPASGQQTLSALEKKELVNMIDISIGYLVILNKGKCLPIINISAQMVKYKIVLKVHTYYTGVYS